MSWCLFSLFVERRSVCGVLVLRYLLSVLYIVAYWHSRYWEWGTLSSEVRSDVTKPVRIPPPDVPNSHIFEPGHIVGCYRSRYEFQKPVDSMLGRRDDGTVRQHRSGDSGSECYSLFAPTTNTHQNVPTSIIVFPTYRNTFTRSCGIPLYSIY